MLGNNLNKDINGGAGFLPREAFVNDEYFVTANDNYLSYWDIVRSIKFIKAGPRSDILHNTKKTKVCIVTCGGLCPGLNVVIREYLRMLKKFNRWRTFSPIRKYMRFAKTEYLRNRFILN